MPGLLKTDKIESRTYQEVIAASASSSNTLVVLPTGLGKTVIAAMVASMKLEEGKVLFMAPTRPLVEQHLKSFNSFLKVPEEEMSIMTGKTRPDKRYEMWETDRVFFGTPQVVENDLISGKVPLDEFSLVIFDEAHRASGDYSYNFISEKFSCQKLALTASPGGSKEKIMEVAENLEIENFEVRTEDDPDVEPYIQDKEVEWRKVELDDRFQKAKNDFEEAKRTQLKKLKKLGQINSVSNVHKGDLLKLRGQISAEMSKKDDPKLYKAISVVAACLKISQAIELLETQGVSQCYEYVQGLESDDSKAASRALNDKNFMEGKAMIEYLMKKDIEHPKLGELKKILEIEEDEKAIVFTEYRASAKKIAEKLGEKGIDATRFIGQQGEEGMSQTEQIDVLSQFDQGEYQVLVSTSVGEEGLDIPAVDYVVFYEPVASGIRDIQRSGRTGRQEEGAVIVLMAENTRDEGSYWSAHHKKKKMNRVLQELKNETLEQESKNRSLDEFNGSNKKDKDEDEKDKLEIYADDRENAVAKHLSRKDVIVNKQRLDVGDFLVSDRTAIERKAAEDLVDSILDNRLFNQLNEITQFEQPVIIVEGKELYSHRDVHPDAIRGALASITVDYNIPILWSDGEKETAELLESLAKREQEEKNREISVRGEKSPKTRRELQEFVVAGIPDINTKIARRLLEEFGSIEEVFNASEEELKEVKGIGEKTSKSIRSIIEEEYS
ncbi:DEAD/DEAH box helicase [Candidatus Nanohalococcus occultus]|uniref:ERCC4-like helicase n=1 Tax=Candidatus Nanohalococcus occultus TaxID=2978047 RepID=A0ABY8CHA2_9ARCH|nr:ERCC4-like helicase [Candidatus Nanohaloarchaeota archaeon SVXNc]